MIEASLSTKKASGTPPGAALQGIYEAQPLINSGDFNFYQCGWCLVGKYLYIAPGYVKAGSNYVASNTFYRIDMDTLTITTLANIPRYASKPQLVHNNGRIYFVGGLPLSPSTTSTLCYYDIAAGTWTNTGKVDFPRYSFRAEFANGFLYLFGGAISTGGVYVTITKVNLNDFSITTVGSNPLTGKYPNSESKAVVYNGKIYFSRGMAGTANSFMVFDPVAGTITDLAVNPNSKTGEPMVLWGDKIITRGQNTELYQYNIATNTWSTIPCQTNVSSTDSSGCPFFVYGNGIMFKYLSSDDATGRRFWKIY